MGVVIIVALAVIGFFATLRYFKSPKSDSAVMPDPVVLVPVSQTTTNTMTAVVPGADNSVTNHHNQQNRHHHHHHQHNHQRTKETAVVMPFSNDQSMNV
jgi:UDP-N-acetylmuramyl pentapeptide phosphotransferase/UDP-N-acetylglucosamine-1-phosphate transferase